MKIKCPACGKENNEGAKNCRYCGKTLTRAAKQQAAAKKRQLLPRILLVPAAALTVLAVCWFLFSRVPLHESILTAAGEEEMVSGLEEEEESEIPETAELTGLHHAEITIRDYGTLRLELDADAAPLTVENFIRLAQEGFYDGLTFHRIMDGFMIQGGRPDGSKSPVPTIPGEFSQNGVNNPISHVKGVISMARSGDPNSASSQFFITVGDATYLDGSYAAFGRVTEGMEVVEKIAKDARPVDDNGTILPEEQPLIENVVITD
ncbi:MAG: peptidylprolyl isomerase [Oscillospiraceae bacterium]|nr:peptidylprolyl isomerase [Oscillospiraceae bacterium]